MNPPTPAAKRLRYTWFAIGVLAFGALMGARDEMSVVWQRSLTAGVAAAVLALCVTQGRRQSPTA